MALTLALVWCLRTNLVLKSVYSYQPERVSVRLMDTNRTLTRFG